MKYLADHSDIVTLSDVFLRPNAARVLMRPFVPADPEQYTNPVNPRSQRIVDRVLALRDEEVRAILDRLIGALAERPRNAEQRLLRHFDRLSGNAIEAVEVSKDRKLLIAAYFCAEYTFEAAALFNPSMIAHPEDAAMPDSAVRFLLSLRSVGEGHVSSVTFRTGSWSPKSGFQIEEAGPEGIMLHVVRTEGEGENLVTYVERDTDCAISDVVLFPTTVSQRQGIEDMRLVVFEEAGKEPQIFGTYTAFDGQRARPEMMHVIMEPRTISLRPLRGRYSTGKGMALFPRKVGGHYLMLSRQDQENIWLLESDDLYRWDEGRPIMRPEYFWEFVQLGNCGSPIEINEGWLVFTHGVAMVRAYSVGACLLDKEDPSKVLARTTLPLLVPSVSKRGGYVPNVVYSCGALIRGRDILLPFAVGDRTTAFATGSVDSVLAAMVDVEN